MGWILRRIAISIGLVWAVASIVFLSIQLVPGDPAEVLLSLGGTSPDPESVAALRTELGLDRPILVQYVSSFAGFLTGDLGNSMADGVPVMAEVMRRLPRTLELIAAAALIATVLGLPTGILAAVRRGGPFDRTAGAFSGLALSVPVFVIGTLLVMVFAQQLRLVPAGGFVAFADNPMRHLILLAMPATTIAVGLWAQVFRMTRSSMLDVLQRDYVRTARAKGLAERGVIVRHALRNALAPIITVLALNVGSLLGGTVLVEYVFNWPGLSGVLVEAVNSRDYPMVVGCIVVISTLFVTLNLIVDIVYGLLDPRVRHG
jgi:peptide/nickel transport system permease protein